MARQPGLLKRSGVFYFNMKVPKCLLPFYSQPQIRVSLGTSDKPEASELACRMRADQLEEFATLKRKHGFTRQRVRPLPTVKASAITHVQAKQFVERYVIKKEREMFDWMDKIGTADPTEASSIHEALSLDHHFLEHRIEFRGEPCDGKTELNHFLESEGITVDPNSDSYQRLLRVFVQGRLEVLDRSLDILKGKNPQFRDPLFKEAHAYSPTADIPVHKPTIADLLTLRERTLQTLKLSQKSRDASRLPSRLLQECFGNDKELESLTREDMHRLFDTLRKLPSNAVKRYKGKTLLQAIEAADKADDPRRLSDTTLRNNFIQISSMFNMAVEERLMSQNPAKSRLLRGSFNLETERPPKAQFTIDELNQLFRAPLYTGCDDDEYGYAKKGLNRPRRGRFWVPLLSLFQGFRCNEACQLYTEDIITTDDFTYITIRRLTEKGELAEDKTTKTATSRREVPIHPELIKIGFLDHVAARQKDTSSPLLFPDLILGCRNYRSDPFSKWFTRFKEATLGTGNKATFHSFRHQFRDATRDAGLSSESVDVLGGWGRTKDKSKNHYGRGVRFLRVLAREIAKIEYPGLDLSHLYPKPLLPPTKKPANLRE